MSLETINAKLEQLLDPIYARAILFQLCMILLVIGGLNWLLSGLFQLNLVEELFGNSPVAKVVYLLVGVSAIVVMFDRDTYLPFLGPMAIPCSVLQNSTPSGASRQVKVTVKPNTKVLYWAAEPATDKFKKLQNWKQAYLKFENAGVTTSNDQGVAILSIREPQPYTTPMTGKLEPHVHYRVCEKDGWMGRIQTTRISQPSIEGFATKVTKQVMDKKNKLDTSDYSASIF